MSTQRILHFLLYLIIICSCKTYNYENESMEAKPIINYEIEKNISKDFYGSVKIVKLFEAGNQSLILKKVKKNDITEMEKLYHESEILKACDHNSIPKLYTFQKRKLFMEYKEGVSLKEYRISLKNLPPEELRKKALLFLYNMLDIADYLHNSIEITHNDIHELNIIIDDQEKPNLIDFGAAKFKFESDDFYADQLEDIDLIFENFTAFFFVAEKGKSLMEKEKIKSYSKKYVENISFEINKLKKDKDLSPAKSLKAFIKNIN